MRGKISTKAGDSINRAPAMCLNVDMITSRAKKCFRLFISKLRDESKIYVSLLVFGSLRADMNDVLPLLLVVDRRSKRREKERVGEMPAGGGKFTKKLLY